MTSRYKGLFGKSNVAGEDFCRDTGMLVNRLEARALTDTSELQVILNVIVRYLLTAVGFLSGGSGRRTCTEI